MRQTDGLCTIGDMVRIFEVTHRTLRFYEDKGFLKPQRDGRHRFYDAADRARLRFVLQAKTFRFSLDEIGELLAAAEAEGTFELHLKVDQARSQLAFLQRERAHIDHAIEAVQRVAI